VRISICHCLACQQRTGSVFGTQARFHRENVAIDGHSTTFTRAGDSGSSATFHFCPTCGSTVYWQIASAPDVIAVAVYEGRRHSWVNIEDDGSIEHMD
jgi:hypothetical protein